MDFDFKSLYDSYSNVALLKIIEMPHNYQAEAVVAAQEVLATRTITDEDRSQLINDSPAAVDAPVKEQIAVDEERSIFDDVVPDTKSRQFQITKWIIICLVGLQFINSIYQLVVWIILAIKYNIFPSFLIFLSPAFVISLFVFFALWLFAKVHKWGWLLLSGIILYVLVTGMIGFLTDLHGRGAFLLLYFLLIVLNLSIAYYLQKPEIYDHYVDYPVFKKLRLWGIILAIALFVGMYFVNFVFTAGAQF